MRKSYSVVLILTFFCSAAIAWAETVLKGKVTDAKSNTPLKGATVRVDGTTWGGMTNKDGEFSIRLGKGGEYKINTSFVGYKKQTKRVTVKDNEVTEIQIALEQDYLKLNEMVVVGYGITQKRDVTGSYATVKSEEIANRPAPSFESLLQGRSPGVQILQSNGMAGTAATVRVRGVGSITANTQPLYVVDGVPITTGDYGSNAVATNTNALSFLNPNDIESIDILKDAAATAIYGSRGANGVVLITTKRGKLGAARMSMGVSRGIKSETNRLKLVDRDTWINLYYEGRRNDVADSLLRLPANAGKNWNTMIGEINGTPQLKSLVDNTTMPQGFTRETAGNTNWLDQTLRTGTTSEAYLTISGGSEATKYYFNTTYFDEKGFIVGNDYSRLNTRITLDQKANDWLDVGASFNANRELNNRVNASYAGGFGNASSSSLPIFPIRDSTGQYWRPQTGLNAIADLENRKFLATTWRLFGNGYAQINFKDNLNLRLTGGVDYMSLRENRFTPILLSVDPQAEERRVEVFNYTTNAILTWKPIQSEEHNLTIVGGIESQRSEQRDVGTTGTVFPNNYFTTPQSASVRNGYVVGTEYGIVSYLTRVSYTLMDRYLFTASMVWMVPPDLAIISAMAHSPQPRQRGL
jgi:TonB-linked SusC/RagA family outer membrane protein